MNTPVNTEHFDKDTVRKQITEARAEIERLSNGRDVKLLAVTKTVPVETVNFAIDELGITAIGENRVQELLSKYDLLHSPASGKLEIHLIGSLQTNKVKYIIDKVDMIESVDSLRLAAEIDRQAKKHGLIMDILVEVNIGREPQKGGVLPEELEDFLASLGDFSNIRPRGLMTIAPKCENKSDYLKYFTETHGYFTELREKLQNISSEFFDTLSMGMSGSYREAIAAGSTEIRLGSTLFGARPYPTPNRINN